MFRPGEARYSARVVDSVSGATVWEMPDRGVSISWQRVPNSAPELFVSFDTARNPGCCGFMPHVGWRHEVQVFRGGVQVAAGHVLRVAPSSGGIVWDCLGMMGYVLNQPWVSAYEPGPVFATDVFDRVLLESSLVWPHGIASTVNGNDVLVEVKAQAGDGLAEVAEQLVGKTLDFVEFSTGEHGRVVKYGELAYSTGLVLTNDHWVGDGPDLVRDGAQVADVVYVSSDVDEVAPVREPDGILAVDSPPIVYYEQVAGVTLESEMRAIARKKLLERRSSVFVTSGDYILSKQFPADIDTLLPGAVFEVDVESSCMAASDVFRLLSLDVDVVDGVETAVTVALASGDA